MKKVKLRGQKSGLCSEQPREGLRTKARGNNVDGGNTLFLDCAGGYTTVRDGIFKLCIQTLWNKRVPPGSQRMGKVTATSVPGLWSLVPGPRQHCTCLPGTLRASDHRHPPHRPQEVPSNCGGNFSKHRMRIHSLSEVETSGLFLLIGPEEGGAGWLGGPD